MCLRWKSGNLECITVMCSGIRKSYTELRRGLLLKVQLLQIRFKVININLLIFKGVSLSAEYRCRRTWSPVSEHLILDIPERITQLLFFLPFRKPWCRIIPSTYFFSFSLLSYCCDYPETEARNSGWPAMWTLHRKGLIQPRFGGDAVNKHRDRRDNECWKIKHVQHLP